MSAVTYRPFTNPHLPTPAQRAMSASPHSSHILPCHVGQSLPTRACPQPILSFHYPAALPFLTPVRPNRLALPCRPFLVYYQPDLVMPTMSASTHPTIPRLASPYHAGQTEPILPCRNNAHLDLNRHHLPILAMSATHLPVNPGLVTALLLMPVRPQHRPPCQPFTNLV